MPESLLDEYYRKQTGAPREISHANFSDWAILNREEEQADLERKRRSEELSNQLDEMGVVEAEKAIARKAKSQQLLSTFDPKGGKTLAEHSREALAEDPELASTLVSQAEKLREVKTFERGTRSKLLQEANVNEQARSAIETMKKSREYFRERDQIDWDASQEDLRNKGALLMQKFPEHMDEIEVMFRQRDVNLVNSNVETERATINASLSKMTPGQQIEYQGLLKQNLPPLRAIEEVEKKSLKQRLALDFSDDEETLALVNSATSLSDLEALSAKAESRKNERIQDNASLEAYDELVRNSKGELENSLTQLVMNNPQFSKYVVQDDSGVSKPKTPPLLLMMDKNFRDELASKAPDILRLWNQTSQYEQGRNTLLHKIATRNKVPAPILTEPKSDPAIPGITLPTIEIK